MSEKEVGKCPKCGGEREIRYLRILKYPGGLLRERDSMWDPGKIEKAIAYVCQKCDFIEFYRMKEA